MKQTSSPASRRLVQLVAVALAISIAGPAFAQDDASRKDRREEREDREERRAERREVRAERAERREDRVDARQDARQDARRDVRQEARVDDRRESRQDRRQERREVVQDRRQERREVVQEHRQERRDDRRDDRRELRQDRRQAQRYAQLYRQRLLEQQRRWSTYHHQARYNAPFSHRYRLGGRYWNTNRYGAELMREAANHGYAEGIRAGRADRYDNWRFDYRDSWAYRDGAYGYNGRYVSRDHYAHYFREGFRRGYEDGYYGRARYGRHDNGQYFMVAAILSAILGLESI